jgi:hypothetical protein
VGLNVRITINTTRDIVKGLLHIIFGYRRVPFPPEFRGLESESLLESQPCNCALKQEQLGASNLNVKKKRNKSLLDKAKTHVNASPYYQIRFKGPQAVETRRARWTHRQANMTKSSRHQRLHFYLATAHLPNAQALKLSRLALCHARCTPVDEHSSRDE